MRTRVLATTNHFQTPWTGSSVTGDFFFRLPEPAPPATPPPAVAGATIDMLVWNAIQGSQEPSDFETFLETYPDSPLAPFARNRAKTLRAAPTTSVPQSSPTDPLADPKPKPATGKPEPLDTSSTARPAAVAAPLPSEPESVIKYRKYFMDANGSYIVMLAAVAKGEISLTNEVATHARALAVQGKLLSANLKILFPQGTAIGETGEKSAALPVIWEKWTDFESAAQKFEEKSAKLAYVAGGGGDLAAIRQALGTLGREGCGGCHQAFREKQ